MWNFRILKHDKGKDSWYGIHEVFYDDNKKPIACTQGPVDTVTDSVEGVKWILKKMTLGAKKPILKYEMFEKMEKRGEDG